MASFKSSAVAGIKCASNTRSPRCFVTASKPLQREKTDKEIEETCNNVNKAADAVTEGAQAVTKATKEVKGKVSDVAENVMGKAKKTVVETVVKKIKDKVVGK